ncbi:uncharacterized protein LOC117631757, partial [Prunus dulcis]|uniref:uncharacterized protein LOC117631757 n=1 Tax=Prunus dulcis TaxID=3755 RepID=UPI0014839584
FENRVTRTAGGPIEPQLAKSDHLDLDLSNDIKGIMSALHQIQEKAHKDGLKKNEETISRQSFAASMFKRPKYSDNFIKNLSNETETAKFQGLYEKFCKDQANHLQALKAFLCNWIVIVINSINSIRQESDDEKACTDKIAKLEESLKKKKQDDRTFSFLRKTLGSFTKNLVYIWGKLHFPGFYFYFWRGVLGSVCMINGKLFSGIYSFPMKSRFIPDVCIR